jgi:hypothetical protein
MQFRRLPILVATGTLWGLLVIAIALVPAAAIHRDSSALSLAVVAVGVVLGTAVLVKWMTCSVSVRGDGVRVQGFFRTTTYTFSRIKGVQAELPRSDSGWVVRSFFAVVFPYLVMDSGRRVRLTPAGSFAWRPPFGEVDVDSTWASRIATDLAREVRAAQAQTVP